MKYAWIAAGLALAACASGPQSASANAPSGRDCFHSGSVSGYNVVDDRTLKLNVGPSRDYLLTTDRSLHDIRFSEHIAVRTGDPSGWVCTGNGLGVEVIGGDPPRIPLIVTNIARAPQATPPAQPAHAAPSSGY